MKLQPKTEVPLDAKEYGQMNVIGGRPGAGKHELVEQIILERALACDESVAYYSFQFTKHALLDRLSHQLSGISLSRIKNESLTPGEQARLAEVRRKLEDAPLRLDSDTNSTIHDLRDRFLTSQGKNIDWLIVDSLHLLVPSESSKTRQEELRTMLENCSSIANETETNIILLAQLVESDGTPGPGDIRKLEETDLEPADQIWILGNPSELSREAKAPMNVQIWEEAENSPKRTIEFP